MTEISRQQNTAAKKNHRLISTWRPGISTKTIPATAPHSRQDTHKKSRKWKATNKNQQPTLKPKKLKQHHKEESKKIFHIDSLSKDVTEEDNVTF